MSTLDFPPQMQTQPDAGGTQQRATPSFESRLVRKLLGILGDPPICLQLWTGEAVSPSGAPPTATLHIADRPALLRLIADPEMQFGEMFMQGRITLVAGSLVAALEQTYLHRNSDSIPNRISRKIAALVRSRRRNSLRGSRRNIHEHYDLGNDFYHLWLDPTLSYTCAYFPTATTSLVDAQIAKLDHVCRKLRLREGDEVIEAGCGWGSLALHAASRYGARVKAFNISHEQIIRARERAQRAGLADRVEFIEDDYRNARGSYDAFVSVGMLEHVGFENYAELGRMIMRTLRPSGRGLIHSIGRNTPEPINRWIERRIFPGASIPSPAQMMRIFEPAGLSVLDLENLRPHYARTLELWLAAFERETAAITRMFDERFERMWRLYLAGSQAAFQTGQMQLFQVLFAPAGNMNIAWTREHLYRDDATARPWTAATS